MKKLAEILQTDEDGEQKQLIIRIREI